MAAKRLRPVHPGDILLHDFMQPLKLSSYKLAKELGVTAPSINEIVRRRRAVTAEMALRFSRYFGTSAQLWLTLQSQYDLEVAARRIGKKLERTIRPIPHSDLSYPPAGELLDAMKSFEGRGAGPRRKRARHAAA